MAFLDYLVEQKIIEEKEAVAVRAEASSSGSDPVDILIAKGADEDALMKAKADYLNIPFKQINPKDVPRQVLEYIPEESASHYEFAPIDLKDSILEVGIVDPDNMEARDALQFISSKLNVPFKLYLISRATFQELMENYKSLTGEVSKALTDLEVELQREGMIPGSAAFEKEKKSEEKKKLAPALVEETPVTKIVAVILRHAAEGGASDIHIEPTDRRIRVRFRVDGELYTSLLLPMSIHNAVVSRIKVLAGLKLDEKRKPQDGSFQATIENHRLDFRLSTFPTYYGEKVVMRLLDPEAGIKSLEETGLRKKDAEILRAAMERPFGMILLTGPTGSGKTTTLYAMLSEFDREKNNVVSLEDPVEYNIDGVAQSQVRPEIGYTFAAGLRYILRQDPDIIMVGEIRDKETAQLAIQAALTGHVVLATLHTNDSFGVVPRLIDMGVDPYLIAPTLILAVAQRLAPAMCASAKKPISTEGAIAAMIEKQFADLPAEFRKDIVVPKEVYEAVPAPDCPVGTRGRIGIFEMLAIDKEIERIILDKPNEIEIKKAARKKGMLTLKEDALLKAFEGKIPFLEVNRFD